MKSAGLTHLKGFPMTDAAGHLDAQTPNLVDAEIVGATIINPTIITDQIIDGRIVGGKVVVKRKFGIETIDVENTRAEIVAAIGLGLTLLISTLL
jgi:hypothetical protein